MQDPTNQEYYLNLFFLKHKVHLYKTKKIITDELE